MRIAFAGPALREAEEAAYWYWERSGDRIRAWHMAEIDRARQILRDQLDIGTTGVSGTRQLPLRRFPYTLIYRIDGDTVRVLAFMHQSRRPGYWLHRR